MYEPHKKSLLSPSTWYGCRKMFNHLTRKEAFMPKKKRKPKGLSRQQKIDLKLEEMSLDQARKDLVRSCRVLSKKKKPKHKHGICCYVDIDYVVEGYRHYIFDEVTGDYYWVTAVSDSPKTDRTEKERVDFSDKNIRFVDITRNFKPFVDIDCEADYDFLEQIMMAAIGIHNEIEHDEKLEKQRSYDYDIGY